MIEHFDSSWIETVEVVSMIDTNNDYSTYVEVLLDPPRVTNMLIEWHPSTSERESGPRLVSGGNGMSQDRIEQLKLFAAVVGRAAYHER